MFHPKKLCRHNNIACSCNYQSSSAYSVKCDWPLLGKIIINSLSSALHGVVYCLMSPPHTYFRTRTIKCGQTSSSIFLYQAKSIWMTHVVINFVGYHQSCTSNKTLYAQIHRYFFAPGFVTTTTRWSHHLQTVSTAQQTLTCLFLSGATVIYRLHHQQQLECPSQLRKLDMT